MIEEKRKKLVEACETVLEYAEQVPGTRYWWQDEMGRRHSTDFAAVLSFLEDVIFYHGGEGKGYRHGQAEKLY